MVTDTTDVKVYEAEIQAWRQRKDEQLCAPDGWLALTGLYWLHEGENTLGSDPASDIVLPASAPQNAGCIDFKNGVATLCLNDSVLGGDLAQATILRDDSDPNGATRVEIGSIVFFVIKRNDQYGVRVRDRNHPARKAFPGRVWYPIKPEYRITATYRAHPQPRMLDIDSVVGIVTPTENPGYAEFDLNGQHIRLEAFLEDGELWFVFKDANPELYRGGRFLYATMPADGETTILDFNKAYNPPCVFTPFATCPLPPPGNILTISIEAGEKMTQFKWMPA